MSSVFGVSGMLMLRALAAGTTAPAAMADLAKRRLRSKLDRLTLALDGPLAEHQRLLLGMHIRRLEEIGRDVTEVEAAIVAAMRPFAAQQALLVTIPGVDALTAAAIVAEIGTDMAAFGTAQRLAAWAGLCPANHESAGKQKRRGTRKGDPYLKATLVTAAVCAARTNGTYLRDKFHRLRARMGAKKAAVAVAHKILLAVFHMLQRAVAFADLGGDYLDRVDKHRTAKRLIRTSTRSAMTSCVAPRPQAEHHHEGAPLSYRAAGSNFRASPEPRGDCLEARQTDWDAHPPDPMMRRLQRRPRREASDPRARPQSEKALSPPSTATSPSTMPIPSPSSGRLRPPASPRSWTK
jgi:hypothetical protein